MPFPSSVELPDPGIKPRSPALKADSLHHDQCGNSYRISIISNCRGGHGNLLQYSYLENPMDRGAWRATVHGVAKSRTQLRRLNTHTEAACSPRPTPPSVCCPSLGVSATRMSLNSEGIWRGSPVCFHPQLFHAVLIEGSLELSGDPSQGA